MSKVISTEELLDTVYGAIANFVNPVGKKREGEFVNYVIPSIPLTENDTFYLDGEIPAEGPERARAYELQRKSGYEGSVFHDYVPTIGKDTVLLNAPDSGDGLFSSFDEFRTKGYKLSEAYEMALKSCKVFQRNRTLEEQEKIDQLYSMLYEPDSEAPEQDDVVASDDSLSEEDDIFGDLDDLDLDADFDDVDIAEDEFLEGGKPPVETLLHKNYNFYRNKYETAEMGMVQKLIEIDNNPKYARLKAKLAAHEKKKLRRIMKQWQTGGKKNFVEKIQNVLAALEQGSMVDYRDSLLEKFENCAFDVELIADATDKAYYTSLIPSNFMKAKGWQKIKLESTSSRNHFKSKDTSFSSKAGVSIPKFVQVDGNYSKSTSDTQTTDTLDELSIEFEITQVLINRPWFNVAFLNKCRKWSLVDPATGDSLVDVSDDDFVLSDGANPPQGALAAYTTAMILVRDVKFSSKNMRKFSKEITKNIKAGGSTSFGGFSFLKKVKVTAEADYTKDEKETLCEFDEETGALTMLGAHIVAFRGAHLSKSPNPNFDKYPDADQWV